MLTAVGVKKKVDPNLQEQVMSKFGDQTSLVKYKVIKIDDFG